MAKKSKIRSDDTRLTILRTATRLFAGSGVFETTISDIAREASLSKGTVTYYFPSKEHLIFEVNEYNLGTITEILFRWIEELGPGNTAREAAAAFVSAVAPQAECLSIELCMLFASMKDTFGLKKRMAEKLSEWETMIKIGLMKTGLSGKALDANAEIIAALLDSLIIRTTLGLATHNIQRLYDGIAE